MPAERIVMRYVREVLRLKTAGVSGNEIARRLNVASSTVRLTLQRLTAAGLAWPLPAEMTDTALEAQLFAAAGKKQGPLPNGDCAAASITTSWSRLTSLAKLDRFDVSSSMISARCERTRPRPMSCSS